MVMRQFLRSTIYSAALILAAILFPQQSTAQTTTSVSASTAKNIGGDAIAGEKIFKKCKACHRIGEKAKNSTGPVLNGLIGRPAASFEGYKYGRSMKAAGLNGLVWEEEQIFGYITDPKKFLRKYLGNKKAKAKMKFKLKKEVDRRNVIAYLRGFSVATEEKSTVSEEAKVTNAVRSSDTPGHQAADNQICIQNNFPKQLLLSVEVKGGARKIQTLGEAGILCIEGEKDSSGVVGVFENEDALEGCSRLAKAGKTQILLGYASFDNCKWAD